MHSFQPSRGRILLEFLCALAIVASLVGTWRQTQVSALLVAAGAVALLGMIRLFDMGRREPSAAEEPQRIEFEPEVRAELRAPPEVGRPVAVEPMQALELPGEVIELIEPEAPRAGAGRRKGGSRKGGGRRATARKVAEVVEFDTAEDVVPLAADESGEVAPQAEPEVAEAAAADIPAVGLDVPEPDEPEPVHVPHAPLFEPEPFVRMQRQAFGRRGRI